MTLQQIFYALTVDECGSMNKASEKLYITQPTLTRAIRELEQEIGINIFLRTHKGVIPTAEGTDFLNNSRRIYKQFKMFQEKYVDENSYKRKFGVSTKHCSFAVKAFVEVIGHYDMTDFEFAIRETEMLNVINDVASLKSEVGIVYINTANKKIILKLLSENELVFNGLMKCRSHIYMWKNHPLAHEKEISLEQLMPYPHLVFEQSGDFPSYFTEEVMIDNIFPKTIIGTDRGTMHNLMVGLNAFSIGSGMISKEVNGSDYVVVPFITDKANSGYITEIGYITKKYSILSEIGERYIDEIKKYLSNL